MWQWLPFVSSKVFINKNANNKNSTLAEHYHIHSLKTKHGKSGQQCHVKITQKNII